MKTCTRCGEAKPLTAFHRLRASPDGYRTACKECRRPESRANHVRNRDRINRVSAAWRAAHPERAKALVQRWHSEHREHLLREGARWRKENREYLREMAKQPKRMAHNRDNSKWQRAKRHAAGASRKITRAEWDQVTDSYCGLCIYCNERPAVLTQNHVESLKNGGSHSLDNLAPACRRCNCSKQSKSLVLFLAHRRLCRG